MSDELDKLIKAEMVKQQCRLKVARMVDMTKPQMRPHIRPHTWCYMYEDLNKDPVGLGIVFQVWPMHMTHLRFELTGNHGMKIIEVAQFQDLTQRGEPVETRGLLIPKRWCFDRLMKEYKGLTAGNL